MSTTFSRIPTTAQLRSAEAEWIKKCHQNWGMVLMETAGLNAADLALAMIEDVGGPVVIFCGSGNNGGDGLVVARHLFRRNVPVHVFMVGGGKKTEKETEASINRHIVETMGIEIQHIDETDMEAASVALMEATLVVDALLGTGLDREVSGSYAATIDLINSSGAAVLAIDIPSGINSDTGQIMGTAIEADATVTFGHLKAGLLHYPGAANCGLITLVDIGLPQLEDDSPSWWLTTLEHVSAMMPPRPADSHKGTFGRLLCIAGSAGMSGASYLSSRTALRSGCGLSILATPVSIVRNLPPEEVIYHGVSETSAGSISLAALNELKDQIEQADAILLGPGLTQNDDTVQFVHKLVAALDKPTIIDADGLNAIAKAKELMIGGAPNVVLTPHPMELSRLIGLSVKEIEADRVGAAQKAVQKFGCNVILKGAHSVVATHDGRVFINPTGNAGMATAGAGDVLSGIVGAFLARGIDAADAAVAAAYIHGAAGDVAAATIGEAGMLAGDISDCVPTVLTELQNGVWPGTSLEREVLDL